MKHTLLIDADGLLYSACSAVETEVKYDNENHVLFSNENEAYDVFTRSYRSLLESIEQSIGGDGHSVILAFTQGTSFRQSIYPGYKKGRTRKPLCYWDVRERIAANYRSKWHDGLEADDLVGIWATNGKFDSPIIVSEDKDLKTIPGKLWRQGELLEITRAEANYNWLFQTLTGDTTDGYPGLPGCGPKNAEKVLQKPTWESVVEAYEAKGLTADDALIQARCARILHANDWDSEEKRVRLWTP